MNEFQRRPIKLRTTNWSRTAAAILTKHGVTPNQVSVLSTVFAVSGGAVLVATTLSQANFVFGFILAALFIQLRLLCNMLDGLMAVENGQATKSGELYNELPDRISDTVLLVAAGYAAMNGELGVALGWLAACLALMTAYIRAFGSRYLTAQDFRGPMAKQHRMFALTVGSLITALQFGLFGDRSAMLVSLLVICAGAAITCSRRVSRLKTAMEVGE